MSAFLRALRDAAGTAAGMTTGEPAQARRTTWSQVHRVALGGAGVLAARGLAPGGAVAILAGAPVDVAPAAQAVWLAGGSVTMLHQPTARTRLEHYAAETARTLQVISARMVIIGAPFGQLADQFGGQGIAVVTVEELRRADLPAVPAVDRGEDDIALLQLTSGSTATPKAVVITHRNLWANLQALCAAADLAPGRSDVMVSWLPLFHDMGMVGFLTLPMCQGIDLVCVTPGDFLSRPLLWLELISRYRGTHTAAPNFAYALASRVLARAEGLDLSSLRFALNGAEPVDVTAVRAFLAAGDRFGLPRTSMVAAYGMAEATLGVSLHPWGTPPRVDEIDAHALEADRRAVPVAHNPEQAGSGQETARGGDSTRAFPVLGPPLAGIEVQVRDGATVLGIRAVGVLHIRGESVTGRYLTVDGPTKTQDAGGWLDTGDLGYLTEDGAVVVCGRVKDVIIMGGRNIQPTDIERLATQVDGVRAGNAVAVRFSVAGRRESFAIGVESRQAGDPDSVRRISDEVRSAVTAGLGVRPALVAVLPVGTLPKTPSGKLQRSAAAALLDRGQRPA